MGNDWSAMRSVIDAIGRGDEAFRRELDIEMTFAREYRRRLALLDPATPDDDEFDIVFHAHLAAACAVHPDLPPRALTPLAIHRAMQSASIDVEEADLRETDEAALRRAIALRVADRAVNDAYDDVVEGFDPAPDQEVRARTERHRTIAMRRLLTMPDVSGMSQADRIDVAVLETAGIADIGGADDLAQMIRRLVEGGILQEDLAASHADPLKRLSSALAQQAARAGLDGKRTTATFEKAVSAVMEGDHPSPTMFADLPAAGLRGDEPHAFRIAESLSETVATVLHMAGFLTVYDMPANVLASGAAAHVIDKARSLPDDQDKAKSLVATTIITIQRLASESDGEYLTTKDSGDSLADLLLSATPELADYVLTTGEVVAAPAANTTVGFAHVYVAHGRLSDAGGARLGRTVSAFDAEADAVSVPSGTYWRSQNVSERSWRDVAALGKALSGVAGVRYAALMVTVHGVPYVVVHDGRRATLIDISVAPPGAPQHSLN